MTRQSQDSSSPPPLIRLRGVVKAYQSLRPLRVANLAVSPADRIVLSGLDEVAAEMFVYLVTGAALPDEGDVEVNGHDTRAIATDTEWLSSLDTFGIVTRRAILLDAMSIAANLALPLTLSIEPMAPDVRARAEQDARAVGLPLDRLDEPASGLSEPDRLRVHLARAAATTPKLVMLEHPTARLDQAEESAKFGRTLRAFSVARGFGWIAISEDESFAAASGGTRLRLEAATGQTKTATAGWRRWLK